MRLVQVFLAATLILFGCEYLTEQKPNRAVEVPPRAEDQPDPLAPEDFPLFTARSANSAKIVNMTGKVYVDSNVLIYYVDGLPRSNPWLKTP